MLRTGGSDAPAADSVAPVVLCVDDEPNILSSLRRQLRSLGCRILTADGGAEALELLRHEPIDVIVSDMRMPQMDGTELLEHVHRGWPGVVRILLTGHADIKASVAAINRGRIDRYMNKPWDEQELTSAVRQGFDLVALRRERERLEALTLAQNEQLRELNDGLEIRVDQRTAELSQANEKLNRHFLTSIKVFSNLIELRGGQMAGHGRRVADLSRRVARAAGLDSQQVQDIFVGGLLHDIGLIGLPDALLNRVVAKLGGEDLAAFCRHPGLGKDALMALEDLQPAAAMIRSHHERFDGRGFPDGLAGAGIPFGARIIAVVDAFDDMQHGYISTAKASSEQARTLLRQGRGSQFDPEVLDVFLQLTEPERAQHRGGTLLGSEALEAGMLLKADLASRGGVLLLAAGQRLTQSVIRQIRDFELRTGDKLAITVDVPRSDGAAAAAID
jgi:response regulator RpfG family c-di-GMP phosphodiesterase